MKMQKQNKEGEMYYSSEAHIKSIEDVKDFFRHLVKERQTNFHPDDDFAVYIDYEDKTPSFTHDEVKIYNRLMEECFDICDKENANIYEIGLNELSYAIGLS